MKPNKKLHAQGKSNNMEGTVIIYDNKDSLQLGDNLAYHTNTYHGHAKQAHSSTSGGGGAGQQPLANQPLSTQKQHHKSLQSFLQQQNLLSQKNNKKGKSSQKEKMKNNTLISASDRIAKSRSRENSKNREAITDTHKPEMDNGVGQLLGLPGPLGAMSNTPGMAYNHHLNLSSGQIHNRNYLTQTQNTGQSNKRHLNQSSRRNKRGATLTISQGQIYQNPKKLNKSFTGNQAISQKINESHASDLVRTETDINNSQISQGAIDEYNQQMQIKVSE